MITLEQYRSRIGGYASKAQFIQTMSTEGNLLTADDLLNTYTHLVHYCAKYIHLSIILLSGIEEEVLFRIVKLKLLLLANDIETNPGPYFISNIQGTLHQGNAKFGESAGKQCACIALYSACFSTLKNVSRWTPNNLDSLVEQGDSLFKKLGKNRFLEPTDLPEHVRISDIIVNAEKVFFEQNILECTNHCETVFCSLLSHHFYQSNGALLWLGEITVALLKLRGKIALFDSHSKNFEGRISDAGFSVLLSFDTYCKLFQYIKDTYLLDRNENSMLYQIQFINCKHVATKSQVNCAVRKHQSSSQIDRNNQLRRKRRAAQHPNVPIQKAKYLTCEKNTCQKNDFASDCITRFKEKVREGPFYICTVCHRSLYQRSVKPVGVSTYPRTDLFTAMKSFDNLEYICHTCHNSVKKNKTPCQSVKNGLELDPVPSQLSRLHKLESILVAQRYCFQRLIIMPKGQQQKIKGAVCLIPVDCSTVYKNLPRPPSESGILMVKLKRKLQYHGHQYFEPVRPQALMEALVYLKENNALYHDINISIAQCTDNIDPYTITDIDFNTELQNASCGSETGNSGTTKADSTISHDLEEDDDPLNQYRSQSSETSLQANIPHHSIDQTSSDNLPGNEVLSIAPGEGMLPVSFMLDQNVEELSFPSLFPTGKFGFHYERAVKLSLTKYANARLLNHTSRFASNVEYLFFLQYITEHKKISDSVSIALRKIKGRPVTVSDIKGNSQYLNNMIYTDQAFLFLRQIPGTPPYWQKFQYEVKTMVQQLGLPTWFMTLSCADLRWNDLLDILIKIRDLDLTAEDIELMSYQDKCKLLNANPVIVARHYQYRLETFFKEILFSEDKPVGTIVSYAIRIEFQMRGSPHAHILLWTNDCPPLTTQTKQEYIEYIDRHVQAYLPDEQTDPTLHCLVKLYQKHSHSKTCRKYKNLHCRFHFGHFFTERTIVAEPLSDDIDEELRHKILTDRQTILHKVKEYINEFLDPNKSTYVPDKTITDILTTLDISEDHYYNALSVSPDSDFKLHLKRPPDSCFINNYFSIGLKAFNANIDLQPVFNYLRCIAYMCAYFTKAETESSQAILAAAREAREHDLDVKASLKKIGAAFLTSREVSAQECVYRILPELWLRKIFPGAFFLNTDLPDHRLRLKKSKAELDQLDDDSTDIYQTNIVDRYLQRPHCLESTCLGIFSASYYVTQKYATDVDLTDSQPQILTDDLIEGNSESHDLDFLPSVITLLNSKKIMKKRKVRAIVRLHKPNQDKYPERYAHHLLMTYYPFRDEDELIGPSGTYMSKLRNEGVLQTIQHNKSLIEPYSDEVENAEQYVLQNNLTTTNCIFDPMGQQENSDIMDQINENDLDESQSNSQSNGDQDGSSNAHAQPPVLQTRNVLPDEQPEGELHKMIRSLNRKQRQAFEAVLHWCRQSSATDNKTHRHRLEAPQLFITGGAGAGKSHLIKTIYQVVTKTFKYRTSNPEKPSVLLLAPTGVAAINISGTTICTGLGIPKDAQSYSLPALSDISRATLRNQLSELQMIIIDEVSMVSNKMLLHIHQRLKEIFATPDHMLFAGKSIIAVGDLFQLPPIMASPIFADYQKELLNLCHPWKEFTMIELTEIMRQKDDRIFVELLNRIRIGQCSDEDVQLLQTHEISQDSADYPSDALHVWCENGPVDIHNAFKLTQLNTPEIVSVAQDKFPPNIKQRDIDRVLSQSRSKTGGLEAQLHLKQGARVMLTTNLAIADRLTNGQFGTVTGFKFQQNNPNPLVVYVKFDDRKAGISTI